MSGGSFESVRTAFAATGAPGHDLGVLIERLKGEVPQLARMVKYASSPSGAAGAAAKLARTRAKIAALTKTFDANMERWWTQQVQEQQADGVGVEDEQSAAIALTLATDSPSAVLSLRPARGARPCTAPPARVRGVDAPGRPGSRTRPRAEDGSSSSPLRARAQHIHSARKRWRAEIEALRAQGSAEAELFFYEPFGNAASEAFAQTKAAMRSSRSVVSLTSTVRSKSPMPSYRPGAADAAAAERTLRSARRAHRLAILGDAPLETFWFDSGSGDVGTELDVLTRALFDSALIRKACAVYFREVPLAFTMMRDIRDCETKLRTRQAELRRAVGAKVYELITSASARSAAAPDSPTLATATSRVKLPSVRLRLRELVRLESTIIDSKASLLRKFARWRRKFQLDPAGSDPHLHTPRPQTAGPLAHQSATPL